MSDEIRIPIVRAHSTDPWADRFRKEAGFVFRVRGTRQHPAGTYIDVEPPEVVVPDILPTCEYCGSITIADFLKALETSGTHYSGSDWKYGYPHKFYVEIPCEPYKRSMSSSYSRKDDKRVIVVAEWREDRKRSHKFYTKHLLDATDEELAEWARVAEPRLGVGFFRNEKGEVCWHAPRGTQRWGDVA